jgi:hypothetical protein
LRKCIRRQILPPILYIREVLHFKFIIKWMYLDYNKQIRFIINFHSFFIISRMVILYHINVQIHKIQINE